MITPRLLRAQDLRIYLALPASASLSAVPVRPIRIGRHDRWDRYAIDAWLDECSGLRPLPSAERTAQDEADAALARWVAKQGR